MTLADEIRALLKANGPLTAPELRALLPGRLRPDGLMRPVNPREIHSRLHAMCQPTRSERDGAILQKEPGDRYRLLRDPAPKRTPEERIEHRRMVSQRYEIKRAARQKAERHERGIVPMSHRALRIKREADYSSRQDNAAKAQAISRRDLGLRDMPADDRPCTETWLATNADKLERLPTSGPRAVSPANRLKYTYG